MASAVENPLGSVALSRTQTASSAVRRSVPPTEGLTRTRTVSLGDGPATRSRPRSDSGNELLRTSTNRRAFRPVVEPVVEPVSGSVPRGTTSNELEDQGRQQAELQAWKAEQYSEAMQEFKKEEKRQARLQEKLGLCWPHGDDWRRKVYMVASGEGESHAALTVRAISSVIIAMSAFMCCLASVEYAEGMKFEQHPVWEVVEGLCLLFFSVEYIVRLMTARSRPPDDERERKREIRSELEDERDVTPGQHSPQRVQLPSQSQSLSSFVFQPFNLIDLLAVMPFFAEKLLGDYNLQVVRVLRILRVIRVLKLGRVSGSLALFARGLHRSQDYIITLFITLIIITILFASLIFAFETETVFGGDAITGQFADSVDTAPSKPPREVDASANAAMQSERLFVDGCFTLEEEEQELRFLNVPDVFWFVVSELTTVGNSVKHPVGLTGQALAVVLMCFGVFYLGFAQAVVVDGFNQVLREHARANNGGKSKI